MIYLDNASTSYPKPESVYRVMDAFQRNLCANPGRGAHRMSLESAKKVANTRALLARLLNIKSPARIVFTQNCTEAINLALQGVLSKGDHVLTSNLEHNSVMRPLVYLEQKGVEFEAVNFSNRETEESNLCILEKNIKPNTKLIALTHASNVTGHILPISKIGEIAKKHNILFLVDAAQTAGTIEIDVQRDNIDFLAFPGHKSLLGPQGTGGLYLRDDIEITPLRFGGTGSHSEEVFQPSSCPDRYESGTLNTPGIVGLGEGVQYILDKGLKNIRKTEIELSSYLWESLSKIKNLVLYGDEDPTTRTGIVTFGFPEVEPSEVAYVLDKLYNVAVRSGLHCAPSAHKTINTFPKGTVRASLGIFNTKSDIDVLYESLNMISKELEKVN